MGILSWIAFGLIAGGVAKLILPGKDPGGCLITVAIGIIGAMLGGIIGTRILGFGTVTGFNGRSLMIAILGSIVLLLIYRILVGSERR